MAETYWTSMFFASRTTAKGTYDKRRDDTLDALNKVCDGWWPETTSFVVFGSEKTISELAQIAKRSMDPQCDIVLIGMTDKKSMRLVGAAQHPDILEGLVPFMKRV